MHTQEDIQIAENLQNALASQIKNHSSISVTAEKGVVTLSGTVENESELQTALNIARNFPGVQSVNENVRVKNDIPQSIGDYVDDALITTRVKGKLLAETGLASFSISVETNQGIVTLTGTVDKQEHAALAEHVTKMVNGVKEVKNMIVHGP